MSRNLRALIPLLVILMTGWGSSAIAQAPTAGFMSSDSVVCINNTVNFTDTSIAGGGSINSWQWTFGDGGSSTLQDPDHSYLIGGHYYVTLVVTDINGLTDTATAEIWVLSARAVQNTVRICSPETTANISAYSASGPGVTGTWFTATSATIVSPSDTTTQVTGLVSGSYVFYWVVSDGSCSAADQVTVFVDQPIAANAGPDQQICSTAGTTSLAGNVPNPGSGLWTTTSTATITTPGNRNTTVTGLTTAGTYTFVWTITRGACVFRDTMQIVVSDPIAANAGIDQQVCSNNPTATLTGNTPASGTVTWTNNGAATISSPNTPVTSVGNLTNGNNTFVYTINNGGCISRDTMRVTVVTYIAANAGNNQQVCTTTATATLNGNNPGAGTPSWSAVSVGTIVSPNSQSTQVTGLTTPGFYSFVYTITNGICVSRDTVVLIVRNPIPANAGADQAVCAVNTATLTGNSASPGVGTWTTTGSATIATPNSATTNVGNLALGNNTFIYSIAIGACITRDTVIVRRDTVITSSAGPDQQICESASSVTMAGSNPAPGTGLWTRLNGGTITTPASPTTTITGLTPGLHGFVWSVTNGACVNRDTIYVTVNVQVPANAGLDQQVCQGTTATLAGNLPLPGTGVWTTTGSATITTPSNPASTVSGLNTAGNYSFIWTVTNGACVLRDTTVIRVDSLIVANAGSDQSFCNTSSASITGNNPAPGTGNWSTVSSATIVAPSSATTTVNAIPAGVNPFEWTITNGACISRDSMTIRNDSLITANAGSDQQICATTGSVVLTGNNPAPGTALWTTTSAATIVTPNASSTTVNGLSAAGTYTFVYTITNGACVSIDTIIITVNAVVIANAGSDQNLCGATSAALNANAAAPGTGSWSTSSTAIIANSSSPTSTVSNLPSGTSQFIWTITNGACISHDTMTIRNDSMIVANAGSDQQICTTAGSAVLNGNNGAPGTVAWTTTSSATIVTPGASATSINNISAAGNYTFIYTITNGACISRDTVIITVDNNIIADAGTDQVLCGATAATLNANPAAPGTGTWTTTSSALISNVNDPAAALTNLPSGSGQFIWTIVNGSCTTSDTVIIQNDSMIIANAGSDQQICATAGSVVLSGNNAGPGTVTWSTISSAVIVTPNSSTTTINGLSTAGVYEFIYTITNGSCQSADTIIVTVDENVIADAGTDQILCGPDSTSLNANAAAPGTGVWTSSSSALISNAGDPLTSVTNIPAGANAFIWTVTNGTCVTSDTVLINMDSLIVADAGPDQSLCAGSTVTLNAASASPGSGTWTALNGGTVTNPASEVSDVTGLNTQGAYLFVWSVSNGSCVSSDTVSISVSEPVAANAGTDQQVCQTDSVLLTGNDPATGTGVWSAVNGGTITNINDSSTTVTGLTTGQYDFIWTITNGACLTSDTVNITIDSLIPAAAGSDQQICATDGQVILNATSVSPYSGTWTTNSSGLIADPLQAGTTVSGLNLPGVYDFIWTVINGSCSASDTMTVTVDSNIVADAGADQTLCETQTSSALNAVPAPNGTWTHTGSAVINDPADPLTAISNLAVGTYEFVWTVVNNTCISADTVVITVMPQVSTANAGTDGIACSSNIITLSADTPVTGTGTWTTPGGAIFSNVNDPATQVSNLSGGIETFIWTVSNGGCNSSDTVIYNVTPSPVPDAGADQYVLNNALVTLGGSPVVISGISPFVFSWSPGTLLNDSAIANPQYVATATQTFVITLTDSTGCSGTDTVTVFLNSPPVAVNDTGSVCMDGMLVASVLSNDMDPDGDSLSISILIPPVSGTANVSPTGEIFYYTLPGTAYTDSLAYVICDDNPSISLCDTAWLFVTVLPAPVATSISSDIQCFGDTTGGIDVSVSGGTGSFAYLWNNAAVTEDLSSIPAGIYTLTITDSVGCQATLTDTVNGPLAPLSAITTLQHIICFGDSTGAIDLQVSGGTTPYSFNWNTSDTLEDLSNIIAGAYSVIISDSNGCTSVVNDTILQPASALTAALSITNIQCAGDTNGIVIVTATGGTPGYSYSWNNGSSTDTLSNVIPGYYEVTVTDSSGCTILLGDTLRVISPQMQFTAVTTDPFCLGGVMGSISVAVSGGVQPFVYTWTNGDTLANIDSLYAGAYDLSVTDSAGCVILYSATLNDTSSISVFITSPDPQICENDSAVLSTGAYPGLTYQWYLNGAPISGATGSDYTAKQQGYYSVTVYAACGIFQSSQWFLTVNQLPAANAGPDIEIICDTPVTLSATGGSVYSWTPANVCADPNNPATSVTLSETTTMQVLVTDANGCSATDDLVITVNCDPEIIPSGYSPNGDGVNDFFVISGIERYPGCELRIFNRWGNLVYEKTFYDNTWNGISNIGMTIGNELPNGTYFYVFDPKNDFEVRQGYVLIRR